MEAGSIIRRKLEQKSRDGGDSEKWPDDGRPRKVDETGLDALGGRTEGRKERLFSVFKKKTSTSPLTEGIFEIKIHNCFRM